MSPNGRFLAMALDGPPDRIVVRNLNVVAADRPLMTAEASDHLQDDLLWRPDGSGLAVIAAPPETAVGAPSTTSRLLWVPIGVAGPRELLASDRDTFFLVRWSADGRTLFFGRAHFRSGDPGSLWSIAADGSNAHDLRVPRARSDVTADGSAAVYASFTLGSGVMPEVWEAAPGQSGHRVALVPGLNDVRLLPDGKSLLALTQQQDRRNQVAFARIGRDTGTVTPLLARYDGTTEVVASFSPTWAIAPSGDGALVVIFGQGQAERVLWADLARGEVRLLSQATPTLLAGWR